MIEYTHDLSEKIMRRLRVRRQYSDNEYIVIMYGLELFLNTMLKLVVYLIAGFVCGKFLETLAIIVIWVSLRSCSGGKHAKTDLGCFLLSGGVITFAILCGNIAEMDNETYLGIGILINVLYAILVKKNIISNSFWLFMILNVIVMSGNLGDGYWKTCVCLIVMEQWMLLVLQGGKKYEEFRV